MERKFIQFDIEDAELMEEDSTSRFAWAKIQAFSSGPNRHDLICDEETLKRTASTIYNTPVLYDVLSFMNDFGTHTKAGQSKIAGFVVPDSAEFSILPDGRMTLNVVARIWKTYAPKVMEFFRRKNSKKVSVEMELLDSEPCGGGLTKMLDFVYMGIQLLGDNVTEASPSAHAEMLSFSKTIKERGESAFEEFGKYDEIDFTIPKAVKENSSKGLELHKKDGKGATSVSLSVARFLLNNDSISPERLRNIHNFLKSHKDKKQDFIVSYMQHGGDEAYEWSENLVKEMDLVDSKDLSYFEHIGFPYTKIGDANPALRGIDPPISVEQANEIARQADAIGSEKGGWGIAIDHFKKTHKVKDGRWVKIEKEEEDMDFAKDLGTGEALKVDKSKEKLSTSPWSNVDKTSLQHKILSASNYKSLVKDAYLLVEDGWEDAPSQHLKYPVMQIKDGTLVYNRGALGNALARATQQGENSVVSKIHGIYKKLGLENTSEKEEMSVEEEKDKEEMAVEKDEEAKEEAQETPEEEKKEQEEGGEEKEKDEKKEEMSLDGNIDMVAVLAMLEDETEEYQSLAKEYESGQTNFAKMCGFMYTKMCNMKANMAKMEEDNKTYMSENEELRKFKAEKENEEYSFEVEKILNEVSSDMPKDKVEEAREDSKNFSLATIDAWKNKTKAVAFSYVKKGDKKEAGDNIVKMGLPFAHVDRSAISSSPWKR